MLSKFHLPRGDKTEVLSNAETRQPATILKEKTMVSISGFFQAKFSATLLRGAAIAIALLVPVSPARGETIDLTCASTESSSNVRIQVDTEQRTVLETWATGTAQFRTTLISDQFIKFSDRNVQDSHDVFSEGALDRIAGTLSINSTNSKGFIFSSNHWTCRRATKIF
jgi:hypothetical protein